MRRMRGFVMLTAAVMLFAASVSACACPAHVHAAEPKPEKPSCHSPAEQASGETPDGLAADGACSCDDAARSPAVTPKPEKRTATPDPAAAAATFEFRTDVPRFIPSRVIDHPPPQLSAYNRLPFANLPSRAPPRL